MKISRRLNISNVVMVVVPAAIAMLFGAICVVGLWVLVSGGSATGAESFEDHLKAGIVSQVGLQDFKVIVVLIALSFAVVILLAAFLTNRFLTRFTLRHITEPLGRLSSGVDRIRRGDLEYRIGYGQDDEFRPVCDAFDDMAARLDESVERDREAQEARRRLIAGVSHDLRSPLTVIRGYTEGLRDGVASTDEARDRYVATILEKTTQLERMTTQMLNLAKLDMESYPLDLREMRLDEYIRAFARSSEEYLSTNAVDVVFDLEPCSVRADEVELDRILDNLIANTIRYRDRRRSKMMFRVRSVESGVVLSVKDDGRGVADQDLPHLMEPLFRVDAARSDCAEGSGLGLAIVAASAKAMGATATVRNAESGGLAIDITFPGLQGGADA